MQIEQLKSLLADFSNLSSKKIDVLEAAIKEYPYFQLIRVMHLKGLKDGNYLDFHNSLKQTAIHTTERNALFKFIENIPSLTDNTSKKNIIKTTTTPSKNSKVTAKTTTNATKTKNIAAAEVKKVIAKKTTNLPSPSKNIEENEYSFLRWLRQSENTNPIPNKLSRKPIQKTPQKKTSKSNSAQKTTNVIKIDVMTEALAKMYLDQKKYDHAIDAYKTLSLTNPEKSSYFAGLISDIEHLKNN